MDRNRFASHCYTAHMANALTAPSRCSILVEAQTTNRSNRGLWDTLSRPLIHAQGCVICAVLRESGYLQGSPYRRISLAQKIWPKILGSENGKSIFAIGDGMGKYPPSLDKGGAFFIPLLSVRTTNSLPQISPLPQNPKPPLTHRKRSPRSRDAGGCNTMSHPQSIKPAQLALNMPINLYRLKINNLASQSPPQLSYICRQFALLINPLYPVWGFARVNYFTYCTY